VQTTDTHNAVTATLRSFAAAAAAAAAGVLITVGCFNIARQKQLDNFSNSQDIYKCIEVALLTQHSQRHCLTVTDIILAH
jgi:hypothetical protein